MKHFLVVAALISTEAIFAADSLDKGKRLAITCAACHGEKGVSQNPLWPNLAGQKKEYLVKQLNDFKAGRRQDPIMSTMAQTINEQDIVDLATYYSQL